MPISLRSASGGAGGDYIQLRGLQGNWVPSDNGASYGNQLSVTYDVTTTMSDVFSVTAPSGKKLIIRSIRINNWPVNQSISAQLFIDGQMIFERTPQSHPQPILYFVGGTAGAGQSLIVNLLAESSFSLKVQSTALRTGITFQVSYSLI